MQSIFSRIPGAAVLIRTSTFRFFSTKRLIAGVWLVLFVPFVATAQDGEGGGPVEPQSFLSIILESARWIGLLIGLMSFAAVTLISEHFLRIRRSTMAPESEIKANRELIENRKFKECIERLGKSKTMFGDVLTVGLRHGKHGFEAMQEAVEERASAWRSRLFRKVEYLNIIGNISPLMGLLGTVMGMIEAFGKMRSGAYGPEELAGGISLALVSTFLGLIVAILSLGFFGICRNRVDSLTVVSHAAVVDLLEYFRPAAAQAGATQATDPPETEPVAVKAN